MKNKVIKFNAHKKEYQMTIIDHDGEKWITSQQLGEALGNRNIRDLIQGLKESKEIKEDIHYRRVALQKKTRGNPMTLVLSWRGVIRVAMKSKGSRSREFRDWAEDVLYEVMMTGKYDIRDQTKQLSWSDGARWGFIIRDKLLKIGMDDSDFYRLYNFRKMGWTQREVAKVMGLTRDKVQGIEKILKELGLEFTPVQGQQRKKIMKEEFQKDLFTINNS